MGEAGVQAEDISRRWGDPVRSHDGGDLVHPDRTLVAAEVVRNVEHHAATLDRAGGEAVYAERHGIVVRSRFRRQDVTAGYIAIVEAQLRHSIAVRIEFVSDVSKAVPLRRILRAQGDGIVAADVAEVLPFILETVVEERPPAPLCRLQHRRIAMRREGAAAGIVEREAEAEREALVDLLRRRCNAG